MASDTINSEECAELLHCTSDLVEELARAGEIPALKFGRGWLFMRADLLVFLAEKARAEAKERRAQRQRTAVTPVVQARRQSAPELPVLPSESPRPARRTRANAEPPSP